MAYRVFINFGRRVLCQGNVERVFVNIFYNMTVESSLSNKSSNRSVTWQEIHGLRMSVGLIHFLFRVFFFFLIMDSRDDVAGSGSRDSTGS